MDKLKKLKRKIIAEAFILFGCIIIGLYISGLHIIVFIASNFYFSDFLELTVIIFLTTILIILVFERHSRNLKLFAEKKKNLTEERKRKERIELIKKAGRKNFIEMSKL